MSKFEFLVDDVRAEAVCLSLESCSHGPKFDVIVGNDIEEFDLKKVIADDFVKKTSLVSIPRQVLPRLSIIGSKRGLFRTTNECAACVSNMTIGKNGIESCETRRLDNTAYDYIDNLAVVHDIMVSVRTLMHSKLSRMYESLINEAILYENQLLVMLLKMQKPQQMIIDDESFNMSSLMNMINLYQNRLMFHSEISILCHPTLYSRFDELRRSLTVIHNNALDENECYVMSSHSGSVYDFKDNLKYSSSYEYDDMIFRMSIAHNFNIIVSDNFSKYRFTNG